MDGDAVLLVEALESSFAVVKPDPKDAASVALALRLANLMDTAQSVADDFDSIDYDEKMSQSMYQRIRAIEAKVRSETVANDLAPKLLAILVQFGMTPASRAEAKGGATGDVTSKPAAASLAALRATVSDELAARRSS